MDWDVFCYQAMHWWRMSHEDAGQLYERWITLARDHHEIRQRRLDEDALNEALPYLPFLEKVTLTHLPIKATEVDSESPTMRHIRTLRMDQKDYNPPNPGVTWHTSGEHNTSEFKDPFDLDYLDEGLTGQQWVQRTGGADYEQSHLVEPTRRMFRGILILIRALSRSPKKIKSFAIVPPNISLDGEPHGGISHLLFKKWSPDLDHMTNVVQNLTVLQLKLSSDDRVNTWEDLGIAADHLRLILSKAIELEELNLELEAMPTADLLDSGITYRKLKKVRFAEGYLWPEKLFAFLRRQRDVLRVVVIERIFLYGLWRLVLEEMESEGYFFDRCTIQEISDGVSRYTCESQSAVGDYLYRGGSYPLKVDYGLRRAS